MPGGRLVLSSNRPMMLCIRAKGSGRDATSIADLKPVCN